MNTLVPILAVLNGEAFLETLVWLIIWAVIFGVVAWMVAKIAPPEPWAKVIQVVLVLAAGFIVISLLLSLAGRPLIKW